MSACAAPVTQGLRPLRYKAGVGLLACNDGRPKCRRLVVKWEIPTVANVAPLARPGNRRRLIER